MSGKKVVSQCFPMCEKIVSDLGYVLVDMEYKRQTTGMVLELFIDCEKGITLDDCEKVSKALDEPLDNLNPTSDEPYSLNISSLGLDRPLTTEYQFNKYKGKEVEIKFYQAQKPDNKKSREGVLYSWDNETVTIEYGEVGGLLRIPKKIIAQIVPVIKF